MTALEKLIVGATKFRTTLTTSQAIWATVVIAAMLKGSSAGAELMWAASAGLAAINAGQAVKSLREHAANAEARGPIIRSKGEG